MVSPKGASIELCVLMARGKALLLLQEGEKEAAYMILINIP
jgi:hypothetical protein